MAAVPVPLEKLNLHNFPGVEASQICVTGSNANGCENGALEVVGKVADGLKLFPGLTYSEIVKCPKLSFIHVMRMVCGKTQTESQSKLLKRLRFLLCILPRSHFSVFTGTISLQPSFTLSYHTLSLTTWISSYPSEEGTASG
ncbi:hypothetical protein Pyn_37718 [Prunus yedoensis var. nudiflora]|uniref:Uncharacterized protein n=1 Tax=Prunus yedoensis var. nudiflora TaxID=2094558 RepID=A0A314Z4M6_PRUYE|nr:hypothetical protein Pyn_37718 [Prunus yedoensis var. nudiflora]